MNKRKKNINFLILILISSLFISMNSYSQQRRGSELPVKLQEDREKQLKDLATEKLVDQINPFDEAQSKKIKEALRNYEKNSSIPDIEFELLNRTIQVDMSPGQRPPVIHVSRNYATTFTFLDKSGTPWDIYKYSIPQELFTVNKIRDNMIQIIPKQRYVKTNMQVMLVDAKYQVSFIIDSATKESIVDDKPIVMVNGFGPDSFSSSEVSPIDSITNMNSNVRFETSDYLSFLEGRTPEGAEKREVVSLDNYSFGGEIEAWEKGDTIFIRMKHGIVFSPDPGLNKTDPYGNKLFSVPSKFKNDIMINFNGYLTSIRIK